ncbi:hypothetical protein ACIBQ1_35160 [Nonomuraea sp. NPDC050153]|uniref:hypothetical protein n=1 Tax=Nonomuraea sp. NPDC050153 TaxID=3364359 RepID=UPI00378F7F92
MNPAGPRVPPLVAPAVGVALWFVPTGAQRASHVPGSGWATTLTMVAVGSVLFVGLYRVRRNLSLCVGAHAVTNLLILADAAS